MSASDGGSLRYRKDLSTSRAEPGEIHRRSRNPFDHRPRSFHGAWAKHTNTVRRRATLLDLFEFIR
jgi:hypothetical protein